MSTLTSHSRRNNNELGVLAFMATITMLFAAFTAAYLIRRSGVDWQTIPLPRICWLSTGLVLSSSVTIELARRRRHGLKAWLWSTLILGFLFLAAQVGAWVQMLNSGLLMAGHPHSSFFYLLTAVHGLHLLGGMVVLVLVTLKQQKPGLCADYWHFMAGLWVFLFFMLSRY